MSEKSRPLKVIFCLPGSNFSGKFLDSWTDLVIYCLKNGIQFAKSRRESSVVYYVRSMCIGGHNLRGPNQKPFGGKIDYTHLMWIDSDIVFRPDQFQALLDADQDIVCGSYMMENGEEYAVVESWDEDYFLEKGAFRFMRQADYAAKTGLFPVAYAGMGFMLVKKGVFESISYPWFRPLTTKIGHVVDFSSEDVAFCKLAQEQGYKVMVDPRIRVGHLKSRIV